MNDPLSAANREARATDEKSGYTEPDALISDLKGENGEVRLSIANGYVAAVRDSNADYLDGNALLRHLRGEGGESLRLAAMGYVMAVRDSLGSPATDHGAPSVPTQASGQADAERVEKWLKRHASARDAVAYFLVRSALQSSPSRPPRPRFAPLRGAWAGAMALVLLCAGSLLVWQKQAVVPAGPGHALGNDIEISQRAASITRLLLEERRYEKDLFINISNRDQVGSYAKKWDEASEALADTIAQTRNLDLQDVDRRALHQIESDFQSYAFGYRRVLSGIREGQIRTAEEANKELGVYKGAVHRIESNGSAIGARAGRRLGKLT